MSCVHDCGLPPPFPKPIDNRPGLAAIAYRIGTYADFRDYMLRALDREDVLRRWTHRGADDPGIALLESGAVVADILTFYQQLYANEAYLRTARWRDSIAGLVRLLGYRPAPGIGGQADFAVEVTGDQSVLLPAGMAFKAKLEDGGPPADFESSQDVLACPALSRFALYKPWRDPPPNLATGSNGFSLTLPAGGLPDVDLAPGDRLLVGVPRPDWSATKRLGDAEMLTVDEVEQRFGRLIVKVKGGIRRHAGASALGALKLTDTYGHFGVTAPAKTVELDESTTPPGVTTTSTNYLRGFLTDPWAALFGGQLAYTASEPDLTETMVPLDVQVDDLSAGETIVVETALQWVALTGDVLPKTRVHLIGTVDEVAAQGVALATLSATVSMLTLADTIMEAAGLASVVLIFGAVLDIRDTVVHRTEGPLMRLETQPTYIGDVSGDVLSYFGKAGPFAALADRAVILEDADRGATKVRVTELLSPTDVAPDQDRDRLLRVAEAVDYSRFLHDEPKVAIYGNLVAATQGKTETEAVLGSGDARTTFQTFQLPKAPLTFLLEAGTTPAHQPELDVFVDGRAWALVDTLQASGPGDAVYVVRQDDDGKSHVQFGDGVTGARLPSGINNVRALYRTGTGASGALAGGATPQPSGGPPQLGKAFMPIPATGGAEPESEENARAAASATMQTLGRLVSVTDYEAEALRIPGVLKARAVVALADGAPVIRVTVLAESGEDAELAAIDAALQTANRCRGPQRHPVVTVPGQLQYAYLNLRAGYAADRRPQDIDAAIRTALGVAGTGERIAAEGGLFALANRRFGQDVHVSHVLGAVQNVDGVTWVEVDAARILVTPPGADPTDVAKPTAAPRWTVLPCDAVHLLALSEVHLDLNLVLDDRAEECV
jgi:hypothetical protein